ncbi:MFS transporter [Cryptosporangium aurantiacum]|uniref:Major Facilitator Superfamily protein n=1 Tax=Cryptosporangium aurantiacum TaxID=134849 RepID=A0A1M7RJ54_9ACTN|nr:MFS transporter [Cryptosporangium aurantiacum]SHN46210.1 Major Facilitator Superfamily protein [Cryptosporangium aurantiacum]
MASTVGSAVTKDTEAPPGRREQLILAVVCAATLVTLADYTAPVAVLTVLASDLHASATAQVWVLNGITFGLAVLLLSAGSVADDYGRRRVFLGGVVGLALSMAASAVSTSAWVFVGARVVQGIAGAAILAAGLGLVAAAFPAGPHRIRAAATWGSMIGLGISIGPLLAIAGGHVGSWRTFYWVASLLALGLAVVALPILRESRAAQARRLDLPGVVLLAAGLVAVLVGATNGRTGWLRTPTVLPLVLALVLFGLFALREARAAEPMIDLGLFRRTPFLLATLGAASTGIAVIGPMTFLPTALQRGSGWTPTQTAVLAFAWAFTMFLVGLAARRMRSSAHGGVELGLGFVLSAVGCGVSLLAVGDAWGWLFPGMIVAGLGSGLINATLPRLAVGTVPPDRVAMGSGANNTARYVGSALGVAVTASLAPADAGEALAVGALLCLVAAVALAPLAARARIPVPDAA